MRFVSVLVMFVVLAILVGCGGKSGPAEPVQMTAEQEQKFQEDEKKAADEERAHQAERRNNVPRTPEQQTEMEERMHRGGR